LVKNQSYYIKNGVNFVITLNKVEIVIEYEEYSPTDTEQADNVKQEIFKMLKSLDGQDVVNVLSGGPAAAPTQLQFTLYISIYIFLTK